jgi:coenzyme F420-reducing hydrogenase alpha subunit
MAVSSDEEYGLYDGSIQTILPDGDRVRYAVADYRSCTNEYVSPQSTAKFTKNRRDSYAVGALARFNVNYDMLHPEAKKVAESLGLQPICTNPYMNSVAQVVEIVHSAYEGLRLLDELIASGIADEGLVQPTCFSRGASAVEVPRGILFHEYEYDTDGMCVEANCIIPTNQNHANIQGDFDVLLPQLLAGELTEKEMELAFEMLVRAYDPCISCSTHYVDVEFVR